MLPFIGGLGDNASYRVSRSLRFRSDALSYLSKSYTNAPTDGKKGTFSAWIKRTKLGVEQCIMMGWDNIAASLTGGFMLADDTLFFRVGGPSVTAVNPTSPVMRDLSAWFHVIFTWDTTIPTQSIYLNGVLIGSNSGPTLNSAAQFGTNAAGNVQRMGSFTNGAPTIDYTDGYMTEINFVDGQALTPAAFGYNDPRGVWQPRKYSGTYGVNGFYLNFSDNSNTTSATLGKDSSGNSNDWTPNNFSVASNANNDSYVDVPSSWGASSNLVGGLVRGNYPIWQPTNHRTTAAIIAGGLVTNGAGDTVSSMGIDVSLLGATEKIYWEVTFTGANGSGGVISDTGTTSVAAFTTGQSAGFRINSNGDVDYTLNGSTWTSILSGSGSGIYYPYTTTANPGTNYAFNPGNRPFTFPMIDATYHELVSTLMPDYNGLDVRDGRAFYDTALWTGTGTAQNIIGKKFQPGIVWGKNRGAVSDHYLVDGVRGATIFLVPNKTDAQTLDPGTISAINSDGFSLGVSANLNTNTNTYVGWLFKQGAKFLDIQPFAKLNATNETFAHALGQTPGLMIIKQASVSAGANWVVWHKNYATPASDFLLLNSNIAVGPSSAWNIVPTATNFSLGTVWTATAQMIAYLFGEIPGFCKIGIYTGNNNVNGPFVNCGFKPAFIMIKRRDNVGNWIVTDTARSVNNGPTTSYLEPNLTDAEVASAAAIDRLSNGFKIRSNDVSLNAAGEAYLYMAVAEHPFKYARAR